VFSIYEDIAVRITWNKVEDRECVLRRSEGAQKQGEMLNNKSSNCVVLQQRLVFIRQDN
jgi:hypothetical protein